MERAPMGVLHLRLMCRVSEEGSNGGSSSRIGLEVMFPFDFLDPVPEAAPVLPIYKEEFEALVRKVVLMIIKGLFHKYERWNPVHPTCTGILGITLAGIGIGLPTNVFLKAPWNAVLATQRSMVEAARSSGLLPIGEVTGGGLDEKSLRDLQRQASAKLSRMLIFVSLSKRVDVESLRSMLSSHTKPVLEGLNTFQRKLSDQHDKKN